MKKLFDCVYQWGRVGVVTDEKCPTFQAHIGEILDDYSNWLHKNNYMDSDYYTEEPKAVDRYLKEIKK